MFDENPTITLSTDTVNFEDVSVSVSIPESNGSIHSSLCDWILVWRRSARGCAARLTGSFILPDGYKLASPTYLIQLITKGKLQNNVIVHIQHYVSLESKQDCEDMAFLVAGTTPKYRESNPVYAFRFARATCW